MAKDFFPTAEFSKLMSPQAQSALRKIQNLQVIEDNVTHLQNQQAADTLQINSINDQLTVIDQNLEQLNTDAAQAVTTTGTPASGELAAFSGPSSITNTNLTGDVTTTDTVATTIANKAVTYAKMQDATAEAVICRAANSSGVLGEITLAASQLLGRGASGDVAAIALGTNLSMTGTTLNGTGGGVSAPTIRGSGIQSSSASSYTVSWPVGTLAGDLALILTGHGFAGNAVSGWSTLSFISAANWNGFALYRVLNAADISTGNVTVTFGGSFNGVLAIITFVGPTGGIKTTSGSIYQFQAPPAATVSSQNSTGAASRTLNTDGAPLTTDMMVYFGSNRNNSTDTVSLGVSQQTISATSASGVLTAASPGAGGGVSPVYSYSVSSGTTGDYQIAVCVGGK